MRTVEFRDQYGLCAWVYLQGPIISGDCVPSSEQLISNILNDYDTVNGQQIWALTAPIAWFNHLPRKYFRRCLLNAFEVGEP